MDNRRIWITASANRAYNFVQDEQNCGNYLVVSGQLSLYIAENTNLLPTGEVADKLLQEFTVLWGSAVNLSASDQKFPMLFAHKEENKPRVVSSTPNAPTLAGFGKVLNSIQGLQQRLEDFSVDDVSKAADKVRTLSRSLSELQRKICALTQIKESITAVRTAVDRASNETAELIKLERLDKSLHLQAIAQASKLVRLPQLTRIGKDTSKMSSIRTVVTHPNSIPKFEPITPSLEPAVTNSTATEQSASPTSETETESPSPEKKVVIQDLTVIAAPLKTSLEDEQPTHFQEVASQFVIAQSRVDSWQPSQSPEVESHSAGLENRVNEVPTIEALVQLPEEVATKTGAKTLLPVSTDFDQRLLDDLIKNYGEFAPTPNLPALIKPAAKANRQEKQAPSTPRDEEFTKTDVPSLKKEGELDRQLKKLIKDYGEYDLYSQQSPINLKTGVIAAFLLLGAILAGFYFFSASKSAYPPPSPFTGHSAADTSRATGTSANVNTISSENTGPAAAGEAGVVPDKKIGKTKTIKKVGEQ